MMKYCLQEYDDSLFAGSKARQDVLAILKDEGYKPLFLSNSWTNNKKMPLISSIGGFYLQKKLWCCIEFCSDILIQWPICRYSEIDYIIKLISKKNIRSILLVHDLDHLRRTRDSKYIDFKMCNAVSRVIALTDAMKDYLVDNGIDGAKVSVLKYWDYLTCEDIPQRLLTSKIVFAGNLEKSPFLKKLDQIDHKCQITCYGGKMEYEFSTIDYAGMLSPCNVNAINGSWGLVWDGVSLFECCGEYGDYLRYNSPHKFSLYIVAGLPVIVWSKSALASYVREKEIGLVVDSLVNIDSVIKSISVEMYQVFCKNVINEAQDIKLGNHLRRLL